MPTFVAMLRGINLGSRNRISMGDLKEIITAIGGADPETYVQSGNVVFTARGKAADVERALEKQIKTELGLDITVVVRTGKEMAKVASSNPFQRKAKGIENLHVTFLVEKPSAERLEALAIPDVPDDVEIKGREVYLLCPNGYGRSKLNNAFFEKKLGVAATTRNWKTVTNLADLARRGP